MRPSRFSDLDIMKIRTMAARGIKRSVIAEQFDATVGHINSIIRGKVRPDLPSVGDPTTEWHEERRKTSDIDAEVERLFYEGNEQEDIAKILGLNSRAPVTRILKEKGLSCRDRNRAKRDASESIIKDLFYKHVAIVDIAKQTGLTIKQVNNVLASLGLSPKKRNENQGRPVSISAKKRGPKPKISVQKVLDLFDSGLSSTVIANRMGCDPSHIGKILKRNDRDPAARNQKAKSEAEETIVQMFHNDKSLAQIVNAVNLSANIVRDVLTKRGLALAVRNQQRKLSGIGRNNKIERLSAYVEHVSAGNTKKNFEHYMWIKKNGFSNLDRAQAELVSMQS